MSSLNKKRKSANRAKTTGASDRFYLGTKMKDARYGMFNSSMRMAQKEGDREEMTSYEEECAGMEAELIERLESLRIEASNIYAEHDVRQILLDKYERANEMLDDCIDEIKDYFGGK